MKKYSWALGLLLFGAGAGFLYNASQINMKNSESDKMKGIVHFSVGIVLAAIGLVMFMANKPWE